MAANENLGRFLVSAPKLAAVTIWPDTLAEHFPQAHVIDLTRGKLVERAERLITESKDRKVVVAIVNPEAAAKEPLRSVILKWAPLGIVVDELHWYKSPGADRTRLFSRLHDTSQWRRAGTGTLTPLNYADLYGEYRILDSSVFGTRKADFWKRYIISDPRFPSRVIGYSNLRELQEKMLSIASVVKREDRHLPPVDVDQRVYLPPRTRKMYDRLAKEYILEQENAPDLNISHRLSRMNVLHQLAGGFYYGEGGDWEQVHDAKMDALLEELDPVVNGGQQALVFYLYGAEGAHIHRRLLEKGISVAFIAGMKDKDREAALRKFQAGTGAQVLVMQEQMGIGIKLSRAKTCIFYSHSGRYADHIQARDRIWEQGDDPLVYVYLRCSGTIDYFYQEIIESKGEESAKILRPGAFERAVHGERID